jgi:hypothetical protein
MQGSGTRAGRATIDRWAGERGSDDLVALAVAGALALGLGLEVGDLGLGELGVRRLRECVHGHGDRAGRGGAWAARGRRGRRRAEGERGLVRAEALGADGEEVREAADRARGRDL